MNEKTGRNDPCPCGSGKKYKNCCMQKKQTGPSYTSAGKRKFTAKVLSSGGTNKAQSTESDNQQKAMADYNALMERAYGQSMHSYTEKPPVPTDPSQYLPSSDEKSE